MNRQERRRLGVKKKDPMISIKSSDIKAMKDEATAKGCKLAFTLMLVLPAMVIHDKYGLLMKKEGRVGRFVDLCLEQYARAFENRKPGMEGLMLSGVVPRELSEKLK